MTVAELIALLQKFPADSLVVKSKDEEGNGFDTVDNAEVGAYDDKQRHFGYAILTAELRAEGYSDDDLTEGQPAVCLW